MAKIILLDSNSLLNRAFYALPLMTTKDGKYTNAVYGYLTMLAKLINDQNPTHIAAIFDTKAPTFRHKMYDGYKCTRKGMPDELAAQLPILKDVLCDMGIKILEKAGYEADDIIGTLAKRFDYDTIIVSGDKDVYQLIDDNTIVFNTRRGVTNIDIYDLKALKDDGLTPMQVIDYKALAGDTSDCIPGVLGIGEKTAKKLIAEFGSLESIYNNIDLISGKLRKNLLTKKADADLSKILATIDTDVPIDCGLNDISFNNELPDKFFDKLFSLEIKSLATRFKKAESPVLEIKEEPKAHVNIVTITSIDDLNDALKKVKDIFSFNYGEEPSFAMDKETEYIVEIAESSFFGLDFGIEIQDLYKAILPILNSGIKKIIYDIKGLMYALNQYNGKINLPYDDIMLKEYLVDSTKTSKDLMDLLSVYKEDNVAVGMLRINEKLDKNIEKYGLGHLYRDIELPLVGLLYEMEKQGFVIDTRILNELSSKYCQEIEEETKSIYGLAGGQFNINSPKQLAEILYVKLGLAPSKKLKTGYSVDAETLAELNHPIIKHLLRYRQIVKLQTTYLNGLSKQIDVKTGKVHTIFKQCVTVTGRLSSTEPNLQNIPVKTEEGREIRRLFKASEGNLIVFADYSQIELRILAHFSHDPVLSDAYLNNKDIHTLTAAKIFGVSEDEVTKSMRRSAKAVNFGIIYGMSAFGLAQNIDVSAALAKDFMKKYFETYPFIKEYMQKNVEFAIKHGYIKTLEGRIRHFPELLSQNRNIRNFGERAAMNMPLQGTASDIIKIAMLNADRLIKENNLKARLILQVHDELLIDCPKDEVEKVKSILKQAMESAVKLDVPLVAEVRVGNDWFVAE